MIQENNTYIQDYLSRMNDTLRQARSESDDNEINLVLSAIEKAKLKVQPAATPEEEADQKVAENALEQVANYIDMALKTFQKIGSLKFAEEQQAKFIFVISETYETLGNYKAAITNYNKALQISQAQENLNLSGQIQYSMARIYCETGNWREADALLKSAIHQLESISDFNGIALAKLELAKIAYRKGEYLKAKELFRFAQESCDRVNNIANVATINNHLGLILRMQKEYDQAIQYFQDALLKFQGIQHKQGTAESFNNIGVIHLQKKNITEANSYFEKALKLSDESGNIPLQAFVHLNRAELYFVAGDFPMSVSACAKAIEILTHLENPVGIAKANRIMGRLFSRLGTEALAEAFFKESIKLYQEFWIPLGLADTYAEFSQFLFESGKIMEGQNLEKRANEIYLRLNIDEKVLVADELQN